MELKNATTNAASGGTNGDTSMPEAGKNICTSSMRQGATVHHGAGIDSTGFVFPAADADVPHGRAALRHAGKTQAAGSQGEGMPSPHYIRFARHGKHAERSAEGERAEGAEAQLTAHHVEPHGVSSVGYFQAFQKHGA
ncbi:MAG: hypothetical protein MJ061_04815 [Mailhella sp.]|nr:hypothetical protein [Mailhella sp.]